MDKRGKDMLKNIEDRLKRLAADDKNDFHNQIRKRVGKRATPILEQRLKDLICLMPQLLARTMAHCDHNKIPAEIKKSIGFALSYFYHARDYLPEGDQGLFGYLDDAYSVGLVHRKVLLFLKRSTVKLTPSDEVFLKQFSLVERSVKAVIPDEARKVSDMMAGIFEGANESFYAAFE